MAADLPLLREARERLIARDPDYLSLDDVIGQFALDLAREKLQDFGAGEVLDAEDHVALIETVAIAIATGMHVALEASTTALDRIQALLSGQEWTADVTSAIADVVRGCGARHRPRGRRLGRVRGRRLTTGIAA